jgi:hypothetical protein
MTTPRVLQKFVRRLHRSLFQSVPNGGLKEIDLSRLSPVHLRLEVPVALRVPKSWDFKN